MKDSIDQFFEEWKHQEMGSLVGKAEKLQFIYRIMRINKIMGKRLSASMAKMGLTPSQFEALAALRRKHPDSLCAQDLMDASFLTSGSVTAMINQLLKMGLIEREQSAEDKRRVQIRLTKKGMKAIDSALRDRLEDNLGIAEKLSEKDRSSLNQLMRKFLIEMENLEQEESHGSTSISN